MSYVRGYEEEDFLKNIKTNMKKVEFMAENCTRIYVWHTKTKEPKFFNFKGKWARIADGTNLMELKSYWAAYQLPVIRRKRPRFTPLLSYV